MKRRMIPIAVALIALIAGTAHAQWNLNTFNAANLDPTTTGNHAWWCGQMIPACGSGDIDGGYDNDWDTSLHFYETVADPFVATEITVTAQLNIDTESGSDFLYLEAETGAGWTAFAVFTGQAQGVSVSETYTYMPGDYAGSGGNQVHIRWRFVSDAAGSDGDCLYPSNGGAQIDLIQVTTSAKSAAGGFGEIETCEPGDLHHWGVHSTTFRDFDLVSEGEIILAPGDDTVQATGWVECDSIYNASCILNPLDEPQYNNLWDFKIAYPDSGLSIGAALEFTSHESDGAGGTNAIGTMRTELTDNDAWQLSIVDFPFADYSLEGYLDGVQVFSMDVTDGTAAGEPFVVGDVAVAGGATPDIGFHGYYPIEWTWQGGIPFAPAAGGSYVVDSIRLYHQESDVCPPLEQVSMRGIDIPQFTLVDLAASYDIGTTHNAVLAHLIGANPQLPQWTPLTETDYDHVSTAIADFLIQEAGFDPEACHAMADSAKQDDIELGMFSERNGTVYYGSPVFSDSLYVYRTNALVAAGGMSSAMASQLVTVYDMIVEINSEADNEAVLAYVNDLPNLTWMPDDLDSIEIFVDVFNRSYEFWSGSGNEIQEKPLDWWLMPGWWGPWGPPAYCSEFGQWINEVGVTSDALECCVTYREARWHDGLSDEKAKIKAVAAGSEASYLEWKAEQECIRNPLPFSGEMINVPWFEEEDPDGSSTLVSSGFDPIGPVSALDLKMGEVWVYPMADSSNEYGVSCLSLSSNVVSTAIRLPRAFGNEVVDGRIDVKTFANDESDLPLVVTSFEVDAEADEDDGDWSDIAVQCTADSASLDLFLDGALVAQYSLEGPGCTEDAYLRTEYTAPVELIQQLLPSGELAVTLDLHWPVLCEFPNLSPDPIAIDQMALHTVDLNSTATAITQVDHLASADLPVMRLLGVYAGMEATHSVPNDYATIQAAIDAATDGDVILVEPGTYQENIDFLGKQITVASHYWDTGDLSYLGSTIIDGTASGTVATFTGGEDESSVLTGFTLTGGQAQYGGGVRCIDSSPFIHHCVVHGNASTLDGAGFHLLRSSPRLEDLEIRDNTAGQHGGGICNGTGSSPTIRRCSIRRNDAANGGGLWCYNGANPVVENTEIVWNTADHGGGVFCYQNSDPHLSGVTIANNTANVQGGGILCYVDSGPTMINSILWNNSPQEGAFDSGSNNSLGVAYCDVQGGPASIVTGGHGTVDWLEGNVDVDPLFVDPANDDFTLPGASPCIDVGVDHFEYDSEIWVSLVVGNYLGAAPDLGFFEFSSWLSPVEDPEEVPTAFWVGGNYPNPFNPTTTIEYSLPAAGPVSLKIYDVTGRLVRRLVDGDVKKPGRHMVTWNGTTDRGSTVASGVYLYVVESGGNASARKMMLLK